MRYRHDLSHEHKTSFDMGLLVPIGCFEVLPGDTFIASTQALMRVAPQANPIMHSVDIRIHNWYCPNRILWDEWDEWIVGNSVSSKPTITIPADAADWALMDHLGIPQVTGVEVDALPIRAYNAIWNERYRDQDLHTARTTDELELARICWEKDYFTTARATPQQGDAVEIPFAAGTIPVDPDGTAPTFSGATASPSALRGGNSGGVHRVMPAASVTSTSTDMEFVNTGLEVDLSNLVGGGINIDDLRRSLALQKIAERRMRFGSRYVDELSGIYGVPKSMLDGRLDRPEYLGGGQARVNFSEVLATAEGTSTDVGDMFGHGIAGVRTKRWRKFFPEHGWVLTLASARPKTVYEEGLHRKFMRTEPDEYWNPELETMPWQSVPETEIYGGGSASTVWGYVPRYDEYRHEQSVVSGTFRTGGTEADWHMGRVFGSVPTLNGSFVECDPDETIYSDASMPELIVNARHRVQANRMVRSTAKIGGSIGL